MAGVTQKKLAEMLNLTARQVRNLTDDGTFARRQDMETHQLVYDAAACAEAYYRRKFERMPDPAAATKESITLLTTRKLEIEVSVAELALAQQQGQLVTLDYMEEQIRGLLEQLRARCLNMPGKYARDLADAIEPAAVLELLERLSGELLQALSEAGEDPDLDGDEESTPDDVAAA